MGRPIAYCIDTLVRMLHRGGWRQALAAWLVVLAPLAVVVGAVVAVIMAFRWCGV